MQKAKLLTALATVVVGVWIAAPASSGAAVTAAGNLRVALDTNATLADPALTAQRHAYVVLQPWQTDRLKSIKAANPSTRVLVHKNLSGASSSSSGGYFSSGVSYQEADSAHPDWFLKEPSGSRITFKGYNWLYGMDVGHPGYQQAWADNVVSEIVRNGWDGVLLDNTDTTMKYDFINYPTQYPTDAAWQRATESALAYIGPRIQAAGKLAIPNIGAWGSNPAVGRSWLRHVSGGMDEMFAKWGNTAGEGYASEPRWQAGLDSLKHAQQTGKEFLAVSHSANSDAAAARYGWATTLLGADGKAGFALHGDYTNETWFPEYEYDLGAPTGPEARASNGVHRRTFTKGVVVVNPTGSTQAASLGGTYSGSGHTKVAAVQLAPSSAAILTTAGSGDGEPTGRKTVRGKRRVKKGKVIARGRVIAAPAARSAAGSNLKMVLLRHGDVYRRRAVSMRGNGGFIGKVPVCRPGRYRVTVVDTFTGDRVTWPRLARLGRRQARC